MKKNLAELCRIGNNNKLFFAQPPYISSDGHTLMGEVSVKNLLFIPYRDTEAGSNPREFNGLKKSNLEVFKSMLSYPYTFRFLHSGFIVSAMGTKISSKPFTLQYTDACLTNGNQTRFLFLISTMLLLYKSEMRKLSMTKKEFSEFIKVNFGKLEAYNTILKRINFSKVQQIINYLNQQVKYKKIFNKLTLDKFLETKVRVQINLLTSIVDHLNSDEDEYSLGTMIAEANNDTQNVKKDDIFGNKYKIDLEQYIFPTFERDEKTKIEYRQGEILDSDKVHILILLRPVVSVGLLTKETQIFGYSNHREPIYKLFESLIKNKKKAKKTVEVISKIIPVLYELRKGILSKALEKHKRNYITKYIQKGLNGDLDYGVIGDKIKNSGYDEDLIKKEVKVLCRYNIEHIAPVLFYRIRNLFRLSDDGQKIILDVKDEDKIKLVESLSESIYLKYIENKFNGLPTSLTTLVRRSDFFKYGEETFIALKSAFSLQENDFLSQNKFVVDSRGIN